jgi:hypothetical protein
MRTSALSEVAPAYFMADAMEPMKKQFSMSSVRWLRKHLNFTGRRENRFLLRPAEGISPIICNDQRKTAYKATGVRKEGRGPTLTSPVAMTPPLHRPEQKSPGKVRIANGDCRIPLARASL